MNRPEKKMSLLEHLEELRSRIIKCAAAVLIGMVACWFFREEIRSFLEAPLYEAWRSVDGLPPPQPLNFTSLLEPFVAYLKLSAMGGVFVYERNRGGIDAWGLADLLEDLDPQLDDQAGFAVDVATAPGIC